MKIPKFSGLEDTNFSQHEFGGVYMINILGTQMALALVGL